MEWTHFLKDRSSKTEKKKKEEIENNNSPISIKQIESII